jgi:hypothetical protein
MWAAIPLSGGALRAWADRHSERGEESRTALKMVGRASRPPLQGHPARAPERERDAPVTAGGTPALRLSVGVLISLFPGAR